MSAALDVDVDDIEQLLSQLEGRGGATQSTVSSAKPPPTTTTVSGHATPGVAFSTYTNVSVGGAAAAASGPMMALPPVQHEGPRVVGKLAPIGSGTSQHRVDGGGNAVVWSQHKLRVDGGEPAPLVREAGAPFPTAVADAPAGAEVPPSLPTAAGAPVEVNFLPVMHTRFLSGAGGITPKPRWGHTLTPLVDGQLLLFGGTTTPQGEATNDLFAYDPRLNVWEPMLSADRARMPQPRYQHAAAIVDQRYLVVYGGKSTHGTKTLGDMLAYDILRQEWSTWFSPASEDSGGVGGKSEPSTIFGHTMLAHKQRLYVFGGRVRRSGAAGDASSDGKELCTNDVFVFHWPTKQWKRRIHYGTHDAKHQSGSSPPSAARGTTEEEEGAVVVDAAAAAGGTPSKRMYHAACLYGSDHMIVHGGEYQDGHVVSDTWALHLASKRWVCLHDGATPDSVPRSRHALHASGEAILAVGGCSRVSTTALAQRLESFLSVLPVSTTAAATSASGAGDAGGARLPTVVSTNYWSPVVLGNGACAHPSLRQFGSAVVDGFLYVFGGHPTTSAETATNHMLRCLATDGVPCSVGEGLSARMRQLVFTRGGAARNAASSSPQRGGGAAPPEEEMTSCFPYRWDCDVALVVGDGCRLYVHRAMLAVRAPLFYQELLQCRSDEGSEESSITAGGTAHAAFEPPSIVVAGNSRVKGLSVAVNAAQLTAFLTFVYTGSLDPSASALHAATLHQLGNTYQLPSLLQLVSTSSVEEDKKQVSPSAAARGGGQAQLLADMSSLRSSNLYGNASILFVDPHTNQETTHTAHTWVLASGCPLLHQLLRPLWTTIDGSTHSNQANGITAKLVGKRAVPLQKSGGSGSSGRRNVIIGPIRIPVLGIDAVLRFLYTNETSVEPHCALHAMIAATILQLTPLQRHCEAIVAREEVNYATCCDFITLAQNYHAQLLEEMSLVTAAVGFEEVKRSPGFQRLEVAQQTQIETIAGEVRGLWAAPTPPHTEQKAPDVYAARLPPPS